MIYGPDEFVVGGQSEYTGQVGDQIVPMYRATICLQDDRDDSPCRHKNVGELLVGMLRALALTAERALSKQIEFVPDKAR